LRSRNSGGSITNAVGIRAGQPIIDANSRRPSIRGSSTSSTTSAVTVPTRRIRSVCCERAASGHAAAAPPRSVMNARCLMRRSGRRLRGELPMGAFRPVRIFFKPFRQGLAENGYFEDKNVTLDWRCAEGRFDRLGIWPQAAAGHQEAAQRRPGPVATFQIDPREALAFQVRIEQSLSRGQLRRQNRDLIGSDHSTLSGSRSTRNIVSSASWQLFTPASTSFLSIELRS
jgi:hypothetical protein